VRFIGQQLGYTANGQARMYTLFELEKVFIQNALAPIILVSADERPTPFAETLLAYLNYRADVLNNVVQHHLMDVDRAKVVFEQLQQRYPSQRTVPMNKQKGDKKQPAYFTGMVNLLIEAHLHALPCDYDPKSAGLITQNNHLLRTFARRVDGCFPSTINPIALWEIKEYYHTTTFGSRIADGIYETLLDGFELEELALNTPFRVMHLLMIDSHNTWWNMGKSYLCRLIDMLQMGYVDEILFGDEVLQRLPLIVQGWVQAYHQRDQP
jgi:hypothetical protein